MRASRMPSRSTHAGSCVTKREAANLLRRIAASARTIALKTPNELRGLVLECAAVAATTLSADPANAVALRQIAAAHGQFLDQLPQEDTQALHVNAVKLDLNLGVVVTEVTGVAVIVSDIRRLTIAPWHNNVTRRIGIVAGPDGYPLVKPEVGDDHLLGRLIDELEYCRIPKAVYSVRNAYGDVEHVEAPGGSAFGDVAIDVVRAWRGWSRSVMNRLRERLPDQARRVVGSRFGPDWHHLTRLAGYEPNSGSVHMPTFLAETRPGVVVNDDTDLVLHGDFPPLPPTRKGDTT
jgi:hypothetical protein